MSVNTPVVLADLTTETLGGTGVFDALMRTTKAHLQEEFSKNRIKGTEYSQVYLGALTQVMQQSLTFLLEKDKAYQQAKLITAQVALAEQQALNAVIEGTNLGLQSTILTQQALSIEAERENLVSQRALITQQIANLAAEAENIPKQGLAIDAEILLTGKQADKVTADITAVAAEVSRIEQQTINMQGEALNIPKQGMAIDASTALTNKQTEKLVTDTAAVVAETLRTEQQTANLAAEALLVPKQGVVLDAQAAMSTQQKTNLAAEALNIPKQGNVLTAQAEQIGQQTANAAAEGLNIPKQGLLLDQQTANELTQNELMLKQICKLQAEFDVLMEQKLKTLAETGLLTQKRATEKAQISGTGVEDNSVVGRQMSLYKAQTDGFTRDAEQKVAKLMVDSWNVRRTTDEGTVADGTNMLSDNNIGRAINKLLSGVGA